MEKRVMDQLNEIFDADHIIDSPEILMGYASDRSFAPAMKPELVVKVKNEEQIAKLIQVAKTEKIPLVPVSSKGPHYRGDTVPEVNGAIIVDLSDMNRILNINRQQRMVVIEPGVTYPQLQEALEKEGMTLAAPLAPRSGKSVIGSVLEVEPRMNCVHQWNYSEPLRCTSVTWGDGNTIYTGEAGRGPKDLPVQWDSQKWQVAGAGPNMIDFVRLLTGAQGSMGIVSWASLKCEVLPQIHKSYFIASDNLEKLIDMMYEVIRPRFSDELFVINKVAFESITEKSVDTPEWIAFCGIAGRELLPEMRIAQQENDIADIVRKHGLKMVSEVNGIEAEDFYNLINGTKKIKQWKENKTGAYGEIPFVSTMENAKKFVDMMSSMVTNNDYADDSLAVYIQPQHCGTSAHIEFDVLYDENNAWEVDRTKEFLAKAEEKLGREGAYYSRPYGDLKEIQLNKDHRSYKVQQKLKEIFDPERIMNPGKLEI